MHLQISEIGNDGVEKVEIKKYFEETVIPHINGEIEDGEFSTSQHSRSEIENFIKSIIDSLKDNKISKVSKVYFKFYCCLYY